MAAVMADMSRAPRPPAPPATPRPSTARAASGCCVADASKGVVSGWGDTRRPGTHGGGIPCPNPVAVPRRDARQAHHCCTSHQAPRSDGCTRQEATGPATPPNSPGNAFTGPDECLRRRSRASTTRHDRNTALPVATPKSRSSSSWPGPGTGTSAPPCATSNPAAKPSPRSPASSAHLAAGTKSFPSLHPLHQCRSAATSLKLPASATRTPA